jgi:hypothetical protein
MPRHSRTLPHGRSDPRALQQRGSPPVAAGRPSHCTSRRHWHADSRQSPTQTPCPRLERSPDAGRRRRTDAPTSRARKIRNALLTRDSSTSIYSLRDPAAQSAGEIHGRTSKTSVPKWDRQFRLVRVHHEHREELGRLRLAGIGADAVAVAGQLGEALSDLVGRARP